jgi:hypothetical protein
VSAYVRFYSLMALMIGAILLIARGVDAVWSGGHGYVSGLVAGVVVLTPLMVLRRKRPDRAWLYPDAPEAWATTQPTTAAAIFAPIVAAVALIGALATRASLVTACEVAAFAGVFAFVVVLATEWISHIRHRRG